GEGGGTMENREPVLQSPTVVSRTEIPVSSAPEDGGLEVQPFTAHRVLAGAVPRSTVDLAWTRARPGQSTPLRSHPTAGLLIVLQGSADLVGRGRPPRAVEGGDVVTLPAREEYGFEN